MKLKLSNLTPNNSLTPCPNSWYFYFSLEIVSRKRPRRTLKVILSSLDPTLWLDPDIKHLSYFDRYVTAVINDTFLNVHTANEEHCKKCYFLSKKNFEWAIITLGIFLSFLRESSSCSLDIPWRKHPWYTNEWNYWVKNSKWK